MKKSVFLAALLSALFLCACNDEESPKEEEPACNLPCPGTKVCAIVDIDDETQKYCADKCSEAGDTSTCSLVNGVGMVTTKTCTYTTDGSMLVYLSTQNTKMCQNVGCNADKTDCGTEPAVDPTDGPVCDPACEGDKVCVDIDETRKNVCADKCETKGSSSVCFETDGRGTVSARLCDYAADGVTLIDIPVDGTYLCDEGVGCNQDKTDCATASQPSGPVCSPACEGNKVCVDIDETRKNVCADKCETKGSSSVCSETDGRGTVSARLCDYAADGKTLIDIPVDGTYLCDEGVGCNEDKTGCADPKCEEDTCEEGFECKMAKVDDDVIPVCVDKDSYCTNMNEAGSKCENNAVVTVACYQDSESDKLFKITVKDTCKTDEICEVKEAKPVCTAKTTEPETPSTDPTVGDPCDNTFSAKCNEDGSYYSCMMGKITKGEKPTLEEQKDYKCHTFEDKGVAQYVDEKTCTVLEMGKNACTDMSSANLPSVFAKAICAKADDGKMHWYFENTLCQDGCTESGCK